MPSFVSLIQWTSWPAVAIGSIGALTFLVALAVALLATKVPLPQKARRVARAAAVWSTAAFIWALLAKAATDM